MAAPKGNQIWKLRSKHGRDKIFKTPEIMLEACYEYFQWCVDNPLIETVPMKYKISRDEENISHEQVPKMRAFTLEGLCIFLDVNTIYFNDFERLIKDKDDEMSKDFSKVITHIREIIRNQKFVGAAGGFLNPNIIARDLGLVDKKDFVVEDKRKSVDELFPEIDEEKED